jgi:hypothetical protein
MRRMEPDHREKRDVLLHGTLDKGKNAIHDDARIIPLGVRFHRLSGADEIRVPVGLTSFLRVVAAPDLSRVQKGIPGGNLGLGHERNIHRTFPGGTVVTLGPLGEGAPAFLVTLDLRQGPQMPLAEVTGGVARLLQDRGQGDFTLLQPAPHCIGHTHPEGVTPRVATGTRGRTHRRGRVESRKSDPLPAHLIQVRGPQMWVAVITRVPPPLVIRH